MPTPRGVAEEPKKAAVPAKVSYYKQIRPIFQAHCQGCHQPAKAGGGYVMTAFDRLLAGGDERDGRSCRASRTRATSSSRSRREDGKAEMPKDKPPLRRGRDRADPPLDRRRAPSTTRRPTPGNATTRSIRPSTPGRR